MKWSAREFKRQVDAITKDPSIFRRSALSIRDGAGVIERVLSTGQYKRVVEIGTYLGIGAAFMSQFVDHVDTIDLKFGRIEQLNKHHGREALWKKLGVNNIDLHLVSGNQEKHDLLKTLDYDLCFIDGAKVDVAQDFEVVKKCGAVLFHDYDYSESHDRRSVYDFVNRLPAHQVRIMDIFALWTNS